MLVSASRSFLCNLQLSVLRLSASLDNMSSTLELSPERPQLSDRLEFQSSVTLADGTREVLGDTRHAASARTKSLDDFFGATGDRKRGSFPDGQQQHDYVKRKVSAQIASF